MIQGMLVSFAISFVLRQVGKFHDQIDWKKVKKDLDFRAREILPGTWFDEEGVAVVNWVVDSCAAAMVGGELGGVIAAVLAGNWNGAFAGVKRLLVDSAKTEKLMNAVLAA